MKTNRFKKIALTESFLGMSQAKRRMVSARTRELAVIAGRSSLSVSQADYEKAKRELMG